MQAPRAEDVWIERAIEAIPRFVAEKSAVVWPEVVAALAEGTWLREAGAPYGRLEPHILGQARTRLLEDGSVVEDRAVLNNREVTAYLDGAGLAARRTKEIRAAASSKRRLYRRFLGWTGHSDLCGRVAEEVVETTLQSLAGTHVWLPPGLRAGDVRQLRGRPVAGGPLDAAGFVPYDPADPPGGMATFAVEVKNVRSWLYPWSHEVWDLLAKLGDFPDVVPLLVARRVHFTTFRMFKDIGAIGFQAGHQWFATRGGGRSIDRGAFDEVRDTLGFHDAVLVERPVERAPRLAALFEQGLANVPEGQNATLIERAESRWAEAAPIAAGFTGLRAERMDAGERRELLTDFAGRIAEAGLMGTGGWARLPDEHYEREEPDWEPDWEPE